MILTLNQTTTDINTFYGRLDTTTMEWTDGVFTDILRRVTNGVHHERDRRQWIMLDGDVDPEWAENLNSVLDDNKLLTLPNGERLAIPPNVRIMFEVDTLKYATLATVSRCGMVWFADDVVTPGMICSRELSLIWHGGADASGQGRRALCAEALQPHFEAGGLALCALDLSSDMELGRGYEAVGNPHGAQISPFELSSLSSYRN